MRIESYQAVIFDLDGVLAFTEPAIFRILNRLVGTFGIELGPADYHALFGLDYADTATHLKATYPIPVTEARLVELFEKAVLDRIESELEPAPGGIELVTALAALGFPLGVASNSPSQYVQRIVHGLGFSDFLPVPVGRDDVPRGKPFPDPYLEACLRAGADPTRSLAVEDSPVGAQAALNAGMDCALIAKTIPSPLEGKVTLFPDLPTFHKALLAG